MERNLSGPVFLKVPSGDVWPVELVNSDGVVWLGNGWRGFTKFYSIKYGHFLVFRYDGNCHFHVLIFDVSASEIEYPIHATRFGQSKHKADHQVSKKQDVERDDSIETLDDFPTQNTRKKTPWGGQVNQEVPVETLDDCPAKHEARKNNSKREEAEKEVSVDDFPTRKNTPEREQINIDVTIEKSDDHLTRKTARKKTPKKKEIKKDVPIETVDDFSPWMTKRKTKLSTEMAAANLTCKTKNTADSEAFFPAFQPRDYIRTNAAKPAKLNAYECPNRLRREIEKHADVPAEECKDHGHYTKTNATHVS